MQRFGVTAICGALAVLGAWLLEDQQVEGAVLTAALTPAPPAPPDAPASSAAPVAEVSLDLDRLAGGRVLNHKDRALVHACGFTYDVRADGIFSMELEPGEVCAVYAERWDGPYKVTSETHRVVGGEGPTVLELALPALDAGGLGAILEAGEGGYVLERVREDSAADRAGLRPGDVLLAVDGRPVRDLSMDQVVSRTVGDSGTLMSIKLRAAGGGTSELLLSRVALEADGGWVE